MRRTAALVLAFLMVFGSVAPAMAVDWSYPCSAKPPGVSQFVWDFSSDAERLEMLRDRRIVAAMNFEKAQTDVQRTLDSVRGVQQGTVTVSQLDDVAVDVVRSTSVAKAAESAVVSGDRVVRSTAAAKVGGSASRIAQWGSRIGLSAEALSAATIPMMLHWEAAQAMRDLTPWLHADGSACTQGGPLGCEQGRHYLPLPDNQLVVPGDEGEIVDDEAWGPTSPDGVVGPDGKTYVSGMYTGISEPLVSRNSVTLVYSEITSPTAVQQAVRFSAITPGSPFKFSVSDTLANGVRVDSLKCDVCGAYTVPGSFASRYIRYNTTNDDGLFIEAAIYAWFAGHMDCVERGVVQCTVGMPPVVLPSSGVPGVRVAQVDRPSGGWSSDPTLGEVSDSITEPDPDSDPLPAPARDAIEETFPNDPIIEPVAPSPVDTSWVSQWWDDLTAPLRGMFAAIDFFWPFRFMADKG